MASATSEKAGTPKEDQVDRFSYMESPPAPELEPAPPPPSASSPVTSSSPMTSSYEAPSPSDCLSSSDEKPDAGPFPTNYGRPAAAAAANYFEDEDRFLRRFYDTNSSLESPHYDLSQGIKLAVIFNHRKFEHNRGGERKGTEHDCRAIKRVFGSQLGFEVEQHNDLTFTKIKLEIANLQNLENLACLALFILTHGETNSTLYAYDSNYSLDRYIINELLPENCPSLVGKPKMIFVQACQGQETDPGVVVRPLSAANGQPRSRNPSSDGSNMSSSYCIPNYADLLIYQASYFGHYSFRSVNTGSWFIQALCLALEQSQRGEDLDTVLTRVSRQVALTKSSNVPSVPTQDKKRQIPLKQSTLIGEVYLKGLPPKKDNNQDFEEAKTAPEQQQKKTGKQQQSRSKNGSKKGTKTDDQSSKRDCFIQ